MGIQHVRFLREGIAFDRYPYAGARVHPRGLVRWSEVLEADPKATPPELRIAGETLFVSAELRDEFSRAAEAHGVPTIRRVDVWGMLLDPFLDTGFDADVQERLHLGPDARPLARALRLGDGDRGAGKGDPGVGAGGRRAVVVPLPFPNDVAEGDPAASAQPYRPAPERPHGTIPRPHQLKARPT